MSSALPIIPAGASGRAPLVIWQHARSRAALAIRVAVAVPPVGRPILAGRVAHRTRARATVRRRTTHLARRAHSRAGIHLAEVHRRLGSAAHLAASWARWRSHHGLWHVGHRL